MAKYTLKPEESFIMSCDRVLHGGAFANYSNELLLTSQNIVLTSKGFLGNTKSIQIYPVQQIKVFNGRAQAVLGKQGNGSPQLDVYFFNGQKSFGFEDKKEAAKWVEAINHLITGAADDPLKTANKAIPGAEVIAGALKDTFATFKGVLGSKPPEKVAQKCNTCGASLSGEKKQLVRCPYCDTEQQLL